MDLFVEGCQGLGLALAIGSIGGTLAGARSGEGPLTPTLAIASAIAGAALFGWSLTQADHPAWPGWPVGAAVALFAFAVVAAFVAGARRRSSDDSATSTALALPVLFAAIVVAGLSLAYGPIALLALAALLYLALARRRRAGRKYEGLRVLR
jgi:asparagine N-glycosylation enzyme membrane subunit Stt3